MYIHTSKNKPQNTWLCTNSTGVLANACLLLLKSKNEMIIIIITLKVADLMGHLDDPLPYFNPHLI